MSDSPPSGFLPGRHLFGREHEREVLDRLLADRRGGVLVLHGEAGVGKTALLEYAVEAAQSFGSPDVRRRSGDGAPIRSGSAAVFPVP